MVLKTLFGMFESGRFGQVLQYTALFQHFHDRAYNLVVTALCPAARQSSAKYWFDPEDPS